MANTIIHGCDGDGLFPSDNMPIIPREKTTPTEKNGMAERVTEFMYFLTNNRPVSGNKLGSEVLAQSAVKKRPVLGIPPGLCHQVQECLLW